MSKKSQDKTSRKREQLIKRTALALHISPETAARLLAIPRTQSLRINTLKVDEASTIKQLNEIGWRGLPVMWCPSSYSIEHGLAEVTASSLFKDGSIYVQNAASWLPVLALDVQPNEEVLDVCAAPGGKTCHIAQISGNQAIITANDNSKPRLAKLRATVERLGVDNVAYTLHDASQLARRMEGRLFDKILLDAPCSGEGMMTIDNDKDFDTWSVAHIKRLQHLQKRLITQAWQFLKPGGTLVYSTCTMAPEENEAVVDYLVRKQPGVHVRLIKTGLSNKVPAVMEWNGRAYDEQVKFALRLVPSKEAEAFFVCKIQKLEQYA